RTHKKQTMKYKIALFCIAGLLVPIVLNAQEINRAKMHGKFDETAFRNFEELNALAFKPTTYDTVINPKLPDSLKSAQLLTKKERLTMHQKRIQFNPYLALYR